ncbi:MULTISPECIES: hypothetical protein [unclassified Streptomyces]|uniref:hypothetical protein n=1 Tax=unclassified Streptomyces TaxID=2593676 RepID=UPI0029B64C49|nr:hypothetical protein [Streptomyces sp. PA03-2a]MDX2727289.1 hypothetical protein [Streptomyces sp. PA03-2a]
MDLQRFHVTLSHSGRPIMHGWWPDLRTAERKFAAWIGERGGRDGARITLVDEVDGGRLLKSWPDEDR